MVPTVIHCIQYHSTAISICNTMKLVFALALIPSPIFVFLMEMATVVGGEKVSMK